MDFLHYLNCAAILLTLLAVVVLWIDFRRAVRELRRLARIVLWRLPARSIHHGPFDERITEHSIWKWKKLGQDGDGKWEMEREPAAPEFTVGPPPGRKGWYDGEVVRTRGIRKQELV